MSLESTGPTRFFCCLLSLATTRTYYRCTPVVPVRTASVAADSSRSRPQPQLLLMLMLMLRQLTPPPSRSVSFAAAAARPSLTTASAVSSFPAAKQIRFHRITTLNVPNPHKPAPSRHNSPFHPPVNCRCDHHLCLLLFLSPIPHSSFTIPRARCSCNSPFNSPRHFLTLPLCLSFFAGRVVNPKPNNVLILFSFLNLFTASSSFFCGTSIR